MTTRLVQSVKLPPLVGNSFGQNVQAIDLDAVSETCYHSTVVSLPHPSASYRIYGNLVSQVLVELDLPRDWRRFRLPTALNRRLQELLDRQDHEGKLTRAERREAQALTELADMLSLMKLRAERVSRTGAHE